MPKKPAPTLAACQSGDTPNGLIVPADGLSLDLIPNLLIARGLNMFVGASGVGKTALLSTLVRNLRDGRLIFGHQPRPVPAIGVINADRGWARGAGEWYRRAGCPDIRHYSLLDDRKFDVRRLRRKWDRPQLLFEMASSLQLPRGSALIIDPISMFLGGNLLDYDACASACIEIHRWLDEYDLTTVSTAHSAKLKADKQERYARMQDQILGSTALLGYTDSQLYLASPEETGKPYYTLLLHSHLAPPEFHYLERDEQGLFVPYSGADEGNCTRLLTLLPEDGAEIAFKALVELAEGIPLSRATVHRVLQVLIERERVVNTGRGKYRRIVIH